MSSRDLGTDLSTETKKPAFMPLFLAEFIFDSGPVRLWTGIGELVWGGETYLGSGTLLSISDIEEKQEAEANGVAFNLTGVPSWIVSLALQENYQGRPVRLWFTALEEFTRALVGTPNLVFGGNMDVMEHTDTGETANITLTVENRMAILKQKRAFYLTPEDQKRRYAGDLGLDFVPSIIDKELIWGKKFSD